MKNGNKEMKNSMETNPNPNLNKGIPTPTPVKANLKPKPEPKCVFVWMIDDHTPALPYAQQLYGLREICREVYSKGVHPVSPQLLDIQYMNEGEYVGEKLLARHLAFLELSMVDEVWIFGEDSTVGNEIRVRAKLLGLPITRYRWMPIKLSKSPSPKRREFEDID